MEQQQQDRPVRLAELYELDENDRRTGLVHRASCSGAVKPTVSQHAGPATVFIEVSATGSSRWTDELGIDYGSVDCAVQLGVGQQQPEVKQEIVPAARSKGRSWIKRLCIATLVLGLMAAAVLVPVSQIIGFNKTLPVQYKLLQPPAASHRILFAFNGNKTAPAADDLLPAELAAAVVQWTVAASSRVHVATFNSRPAMQQALALLATATDLRYAVADFKLLQDSVVSTVINPGQLFDLSRLPTRQLRQQAQQEQQQRRSAVAPESIKALKYNRSSSSYRAAQASRLQATHRHRLAQRKAKRRQLLLVQPGLASIGLPATASDLFEQQQQHWVADAAQPQHQEPSATTGPLPVSRLPGGTGDHTMSLQQQQQQPQSDSKSSTNCAESGLQDNDISHHSYSSSWANSYTCGSGTSTAAAADADAASKPDTNHSRSTGVAADRQLDEKQHHQQRKLQQLPPLPVAPTPQPQQAQAKQHVQKGGQGVAWHLTAAGLDAKKAWNKTYGLDEVVVAVISSGIELSHSGLGPSVWANAAEVAGDGFDNDGNGYIDDVMGWDFGGSCADAACSHCSPSPDPSDMSGWGTHAAAVIAAQPEVASGTAGIAPGVRVMALKVADCRAGMQLGDWAVPDELGSATGSSTASGAGSSSSGMQRPGHGEAAPVLLASAAVQAFDYALLNGAHIVLAGWRAGSVLDSSSSSDGDNAAAANSAATAASSTAGSQQQQMNCALGTAAGSSGAAASSSACLAAVQRLLFMDALQPLQQAGVLVVTMHPDDSESSISSSGNASAAAGDTAAAPLPCSLGLELSNVLCVASTPPDTASAQPLAADVPPAVFFDNLVLDMGGDGTLPQASANDSSSNSNATDSSSANSTDSSRRSGNGNATAHYSNAPDADIDAAPDQETNTITSIAGAGRITPEAGVMRHLLLARSPVALLAPGRNIMGGWAWGGHAAVSGGSAAAAVAAGAAALIWSNLGLTLGAEASGAAAHEGLGQLVRQMLVDSGSSSSSSDAAGSTQGSAGPNSTGDRGSVVARSPKVAIMGGSSSSSSTGGSFAEVSELNLVQALQLSTAYTGRLHLKPAQLTTAITAASGSLGYSWHISSASSGPYDTAAMAFVTRKALNTSAPFPLSDWEFFGYTSLVEVQGFVVVQNPGNYSLAVASKDRFIVWLQDKWLTMGVIGEAGPGLGLDAGAWTAGVLFTEPGLYKLRIIIYMPSLSPFDLKWLPPGATAYSHIPRFVSFGRSQPLPLQLADQISSRMLMHHRSSSRGAPSSSTGSKISSELSSSNPAGAAVLSKPSVTAVPVGADEIAQSAGAVSSKDAAVDAAVGSTVQASLDSSSHSYDDKPAYDSAAPVAEPHQPEQQQQYFSSGADDISSSSPDGISTGRSGQQSSSFGSLLHALFGSLGFDFERGGGQAMPPAAAQQPGAAATPGGTDTGEAEFSSSPMDFAGMQSTSDAQQQQQQQQQQPITRRRQRSLHAIQWVTEPFSRLSAVAPLPGVFSVAATLDQPWEYRTIIPSLKSLNLQRTGILRGPGLDVTTQYELQKTLLGYTDASDGRSAYGVIQGWLDWQDLHPAAVDWLQNTSSSSSSASLGSGFGDVVLGGAGVQFELLCGTRERPHACALHIDGMVVAGSIGQPSMSACIVPARRLITSSSDAAVVQQQLHLELLFAADDLREAAVSVKSRPCLLATDGSAEVPGGSDGSFADMVPAAGASALGLSLADVAVAAGGSSSNSSSSIERYMHGMLCTVRATVPAQVAAAGGSSKNSSSRQLEKVVMLTAQQLQQAAASSNDAVAAEAAAAAAAANDTAAAAASAGTAHDSHMEATAQIVASVPGISIQQLAPEWVATLPRDTSYGLTCGCYWNGSWPGGVSVGVGAGNTGTASLYLAGWPVDVQCVLPQYGPSDIEVKDYSSWQQRQQLASSSPAADPIRWRMAGSGSVSGIGGLGLSNFRDPAVVAQIGYRPSMLADGPLFSLGKLTGLYAYAVPPGGGFAQLLVLHVDGLSATGRLVVVADVAEAVELSASNSTRPFAALKAGWMPGEWDAWLPA